MAKASIEQIESALQYLDPNTDREQWIRVGMAIKSELGDSGFDIFDTWSQQADSYKKPDTNDTWKSIKSGGGVGIGSLFHLAKEHGWVADKPAEPVSANEVAKRKADAEKRKQKEKEQAEKQLEKQQKVQTAMVKRWDSSSVATADHPYLQRKRIKPYGIRLEGDGLLVPMCDLATGELWNIQTIYPAKRKIRGSGEPRDKDFPPGGRKRGLCHVLGTSEDGQPLVIAEGYATAASIFEATGYAVLTAFDSGNLKPIAQAARIRFPASSIVIAADNDQWTRNNPGLKKAGEAAESIDGVVALPKFPDEVIQKAKSTGDKPTDFNDLRVLFGVEVVEKGIKSALNRYAIPKGFRLNRDGVFFEGDERTGAEWVSSPLKVSAVTRGSLNKDWGRLLEFNDMDGRVHQWAMPMEMVSGDGNEYRKVLLNSGMRIAPGTRTKNLLTQYIQTCNPTERARCVAKTGWHDDLYVLPDEVIGEQEGERVILQTTGGHQSGYGIKGDIDSWRGGVARYCAGNSRLVLAVSTAFAPVLLNLLNMESGGFHFRGNSSIGKSTMLFVAASVWGGTERVRRWRTTDNGLEGLAQAHNDSLLCLDELKELDPKDAGKVIYMLANGQGKQRAGRDGEQREPASWRILFVSTGELSIADHIKDGGNRVHAGQEVRIADIPADPEKGLGVFEMLHELPSGGLFAQHLMRVSRGSHGAPSREFIKRVTNSRDDVAVTAQEMRERFASQFVPKDADGQVYRVADRFALVAVAGELATEWGITGWEPGEATRSANQCFRDWLKGRGGAGKKETTELLRQVRGFIQAHGSSRFEPLGGASKNYIYGNRAGYLEESGSDSPNTFHMMTEVFSSEVCKGFDPKFAARTLKEAGFLEHEKGRLNQKLPRKAPDGSRPRVYTISGKILEED